MATAVTHQTAATGICASGIGTGCVDTLEHLGVSAAASMAEPNALKTGHVVVVTVSSAAASFAAMYYLMRIRGAQQDAGVNHDTERRGFSAAVSSWFESWPWTLRSASQEAAGPGIRVNKHTFGSRWGIYSCCACRSRKGG